MKTSAPRSACLRIGGMRQTVSGVGMSGHTTSRRIGMSTHSTDGCAPRNCTPAWIQATVDASTMLRPPCRPSGAATIRTCWPAWIFAQ